MSNSLDATPVAEGLFEKDDEGAPHLIGSRCRACQEVNFPKQAGCPSCTAEDTEEIRLSTRGTLWTWTIQRFPPPPPYLGPTGADFVAYGVGYIELPEGLRVEARLLESDAERLEIGMPMELVLERFCTDESDSDVETFAFRPVADETSPEVTP